MKAILRSTFRLGAALGGMALAALPVAAADMAQHRAVYDISLIDSTGKSGVEAAKGRIVYEFIGSPCLGYTQNFRQLTELSGGEIGMRAIDTRSATFEEADGSAMRFTVDNRVGSAPVQRTEGAAKRADGKVSVRTESPTKADVSFPGDTVFPTAHYQKLIEAAKAGAATLNLRVFDGADDGTTASDTFSVIGRPIHGSGSLEPSIVAAGWDKLTRWPVTISYFDQGDETEPSYTVFMELFENGLSRNLRLDYKSFSLKGDLKTVEPIAAEACP